MRITFDATFRDGVDAINRAAEDLARAQQQVSTGKRINHPSDDPAGNASAMSQNSALAQIDVYTRAADAATNRLSIADSVLNDIVNQLQAAQTAALAASGSNVSSSQRNASVARLQSVRDALVSDLNTQVNGVYLFAGTKSTTAPFTQAANGTVSAYQGNSTTAAVDISSSRSAPTTLDGSQITQGTDPSDVFTVIANLVTAIQAGDDTAIGVGAQDLLKAFHRATDTQTIVGTALNAIEDGRQQLTASKTQALTRLSRLQDADMAAAISAMTKADTAYRAAIGAMANLGRTSLMDYLK